MTASREVWVLAEQKEGELEEVALELTCAGRRVADKLDGVLANVVFGSQVAGLIDTLASYGADKVYSIDDSLLQGFTAEAYAEALSILVNEEAPEILLCGDTTFQKDLASRLAARLNTGLAPGCIDLDVSDDGLLLAVRPVYGDHLEAVVVCPMARPQIATVRPGVMDVKPPRSGRKPQVITVSPQPSPEVTRSRIIGFVKADPKTLRLDQAEIIVAGGGGVGGAEGFRLIEELSELLGGCVGASRIPVDRGWVPADKQIGQTGVIVAPKLYIALGISGSIYHTMGMKDSKVIVAINKHRNAPIFELADLGIVGDWQEIVGTMISRLSEAG
jgi:electron transfer flavoprotein alpha subunit